MHQYIHSNIVKITLTNELDIVLAYKRANELAQLTGLAVSPQTRFATAVSEICRNVLEHVGEGNIKFSILEVSGYLFLEALVVDRGRGIANVEELLKKKIANTAGKGWGIINAKKLVDKLSIESDSNKGTTVRLLKKIPYNHPPINKTIIQGWIEYFANEIPISPYEEIKRQNMQLLEVMDALRIKNIETEHQMEEIKALNEEVTSLLKEREDSNELLQKMNRELEDFAYTVSHDLKAPLKNILGIIALLKKNLTAAENEKAKKQFEMLVEQVQRMDKLINGILSYAKSGKQQVDKKKVDVDALLKEVITSIHIPAGFRITIGENMPVLETEDIYLQQIFSNLIENAIKYHDQEKGNIEISCLSKDTFFEFAIADDGPGIPPQYHDKIFKIYYSLNGSTAKNSTGLGLSIVKKITSEKGGKVWVESQGRGSTFHFTWPS